MNVEYAHRQPANRKVMASKIDQTIHASNILTLKNGTEMEQHIYEKSKSKEEYFMFITRLLVIIRECGSRLDGYQGVPAYSDIEQPVVDPLGELPTLVERGPCESEVRKLELARELELPQPSMRSGGMLSPSGRSEQSEKYQGDYSWKTPAFRKSVIIKFDDASRLYGKPTCKNVMELEQILFEKAKTREEYMGYADRVLTYIQEMDARIQSNDDERPVSDVSDLIPTHYTAFLARKTGRINPFASHYPQMSHSPFLSRIPPKQILGGG